jgi:putative transposase
MIDRSHKLPLSRQAALLHLGRGSLYYAPRPVPAGELAVMPVVRFPRTTLIA